MKLKNYIQIAIIIVQIFLVISMFKLPTNSIDSWFIAIAILLLCIICILIGGLW